MIYAWDEIRGEVLEVTGDSNLGSDYWDPEISKMMNSDDNENGWHVDHVIDLPNGIRIVIEMDGRTHTAVWVTTPDDDA